NAGEFGEPQSVLGVRGDAGGPSLNAPLAQEKADDRRFNGVGAGTNNQKRSVWSEAVEEGRDGLAAGRGAHDDASAAEFLKFGGGVGGGSVDVDVGAELFGEYFAVFAAADGGDPVTELVGELNAEMAEAANSLDGDQVTWASAAVA